MKHYVVKGPNKVRNKIVSIEGAKNCCLPLMASSVLFDDPVTFTNVPLVKDVVTMSNLLTTTLDSKVEISEKRKSITITNKKPNKIIIPHKLTSTMRASCLLLGSLLGKYPKKRILVAQPGGCALGTRGIDFHISGFRALGADCFLKNGYINISAKKGLTSNTYKFPQVSVTGTSNVIFAAVLSNGTSVIKGISIEPEVIDVINWLNKCGAKIKRLKNEK